MGVEIPLDLRRVENPRRGGVATVFRLPQYVAAMHLAETQGFNGSCDIIGLPGDSYADGIRVPNGKVRVELVTPTTLNGKMTLSSFLSLVDSTIEELEDPIGDPKVPQSLRTAYAAAKRMYDLNK